VTQFDISNPERALHATQWCQDNLKEDQWGIEWLTHRWGAVKFTFNNLQQATLFALQWAE